MEVAGIVAGILYVPAGGFVFGVVLCLDPPKKSADEGGVMFVMMIICLLFWPIVLAAYAGYYLTNWFTSPPAPRPLPKERY